MDLRGLAGLAERVLAVLGDPDACSRDSLELFGVSRICDRRGLAARARELYAKSIAADLPAEPARVARKALARLAKRERDFALACEVWEQMLGQGDDDLAAISREGLDAYEELAIHCERRDRDPHRATTLVREALAELRRARRLGTLAAAVCSRYQERFARRLARLQRKTARGVLVPLAPPETESVRRVRESN
jgi:hypothetical protein